MENTYWNNKGKYQDLATKLQERVPAMGECPLKYTKNKKLEKFRKASNAYYDIFNNGGCNRPQSIARIFDFAMSHMRDGRSYQWTRIHEIVEPVMDKIILEAAQEQGVA